MKQEELKLKDVAAKLLEQLNSNEAIPLMVPIYEVREWSNGTLGSKAVSRLARIFNSMQLDWLLASTVENLYFIPMSGMTGFRSLVKEDSLQSIPKMTIEEIVTRLKPVIAQSVEQGQNIIYICLDELRKASGRKLGKAASLELQGQLFEEYPDYQVTAGLKTLDIRIPRKFSSLKSAFCKEIETLPG